MPRTEPDSIPLAKPEITEADVAAVVDVLRSRRLSLGPAAEEFEEVSRKTLGVKHAVAVSNGTCALHLCIRALNIKEGDEVITAPFSFIASSNCILFEKAKPVFVDVLPETYCIDPAKVEAAITPKTKAILAVDIFGYLAEWEALQKIAKKNGLALIEDSCEALGSKKGKAMAGAFADCGVFGFYPNKQITCGEGGLVVTDRDDIAKAARMLRNQGRDDSVVEMKHMTLGYNYRLSDLNCALASSQMKRLQQIVKHRQEIAAWYSEELKDVAGIHLPSAQTGVDISWFVYVVRLADHFAPDVRDQLMQKLRARGIGCNSYLPAIHLQPFYRNELGYKEGQFPITERLAARTMALPFFTEITPDEVKKVASVLREELSQLSQ